MDFDFLPKLPKSDLDDRTFKDLVDECILRIPRYCPEWTNYNPGDPGITLVELFAWLTDQMLMRFNQVPRRNFVVFLEMLGVQLQAAAAARTELTFYLSAELPQAYQIAAGTEVATLRTETEVAIVFSTDQPLVIGKPRITQFLTAERTETVPQMLRDRLTNLWTQQTDGSWDGREQTVFAELPQPGNCFYLVLDPDQPIEGNVLALKLRGEAATSTGITEFFSPGFVAGAAHIGEDAILGGGRPFYFTVYLRPDGVSQIDEGLVRTVIEQEKPAFCTYDLFVQPCEIVLEP